MILTTPRLHLIPMTISDIDIFHASNIDPFVRRFLWDDEIISHALSLKILKEVAEKFERHHWGLWKILDASSGAYMGYTGLWLFFDEKQPQLIFALLPQFTGHGYALESAKVIADYAFYKLHFDYLIAATDPPNLPSIRICQKLGMVFKEEKEVDEKPTLFYELRKPNDKFIK